VGVGEEERAETWLRRAIAVARREGDECAYALALAALGNLYRRKSEAGKVPPARARHYLQQAFIAARRHSVRLARRDAAFGLFQLALNAGDDVMACRFARTTQGAWHKEQPDTVPVLLALARFWVDRGENHRGAGALERLSQHAGELSDVDALASAAMLARAFALRLGRKSRKAAARAWTMLENDSIPPEAALEATLDLSHAAAQRRDHEAFERASRAALRYAPGKDYERTRDTVAALSGFVPRTRKVPQ
jgi:hypothetical protein